MSMNETYFNYKGFRWMWAGIALSFTALLLYWVCEPISGHYGKSLYGLISGFLALVLLFTFLSYGFIKRRYGKGGSVQKARLSLHIWLAFPFLLLVLLHAGLKISFSLHGLTLVFVLLSVASGVWGVVNYGRYQAESIQIEDPAFLSSLHKKLLFLGDRLREIENGKSDAFENLVRRLDVLGLPQKKFLIGSKLPERIAATKAAGLVVDLPANEREAALTAIDIINRQREHALKLSRAARQRFWLRVWLYVHVPTSFAAGLLVILHVFLVLFY